MKNDGGCLRWWLNLTRILSASIVGAGFAADVGAVEKFAKPISLPDIHHTTSYAKRGVKLAVPGNWTVISNETDSKMAWVELEAHKSSLEGIALNTQLHIYPLSMAPTLQDAAEFLTKLARDESQRLTATKYQPLQLSGGEAVSARYTDNNFEAGSPYAKHMHIYARKVCGKGFVCIVFTQTLEVNEQAARLGLDKVVSTLSYSR